MDNPVLTIAGVMPGGPEVTNWRSGMNHPTASIVTRRSSTRGPSISIAGVMPGGPAMTHWRTAFPTGESIYVDALRAAEAKAALENKVVGLPTSRSRHEARRRQGSKAA